MLRRTSVLICCIIVLISLLQSQPKLLWTITQPTSDSMFYMHDATKDFSGNLFVFSNGLTKYSNTGARLWSRSLSILGNYGYKMTADKQGNVYIVANNDDQKQTLMKYSPSGDSLWAKTLTLEMPSGDYRSQNRLITSDGDGNVYIAVQHEQRKPGEIFQTFLMVSSYSSGGQLRWLDTTVKAMTLTREPEYGDLMLGKMIVDQANDIIVSVSSRSEINPSLYIAETKIIKYSSEGGNPQWVNSLSIPGVNVEFSDMDVDALGNVFVGYSGGMVRKYNSQGAFQWQRIVSGGMKLAADNNGGVYVGDGKFETFLKTVARVFHFTNNDSTYLGNVFGSYNYASISHIAVDQAGYLGVSGFGKSSFSAPEGSYYFFEYTPSGIWNGFVMYASPGISYEFPHYLFKGNGTYTIVGQSIYPKSKSVLWIGKIQVAPDVPPVPGGNGGNPEPPLTPILIPSGTTANLHGVWFRTAFEGFIVGDNSTILRTTDVGSTWEKSTSPVVSDFKKVRFIDADSGFIIGQSYILKTKNKGVTWNIVDEFGNQTLYGIDWNDSGMVVAVGSQGIIRRSTDWGNTWQNKSIDNSNITLWDVKNERSIDPSDRFIAGGDLGMIIKTTDGGNNWRTLQGPSILGGNIRTLCYYYELASFFGTTVYSYNNETDSVKTVSYSTDPLLSFMDLRYKNQFTGVGENGTFVSYEHFNDIEKEKYWKIKLGSSALRGVYQDELFCIVVGDNGVIYKLIDGIMISYRPDSFRDLVALSKTDALIRGIDQSLYRTSDAGKTWSMVLNTPTVNVHAYPNSNVLFATQFSGDTLFRSSDKGVTWTTVRITDTSVNSISEVKFGNDATAWARVTMNDFTSKLYRTNNYGQTWTELITDAINWYMPVDSTFLWIKEHSFLTPIKFSDDGGDSWKSTQIIDGILPITRDIAILHVNESVDLWTSNRGISRIPLSLPNRIYVNLEHSTELIDRSTFHGPFRNSTDAGLSWQQNNAYFYADLDEASRIRIGDSTYLEIPGLNGLYLTAPKPVKNVPLSTPPIFVREKINKTTHGSSGTSDTLFVPSNKVGGNATKIIMRIDSLLAASTKLVTITLSHNGIVDTVFFKHEGKDILYCTLSDGASNPLAVGRAKYSFKDHFDPYSPLKIFNHFNPSGNWIITVYNEDTSVAELRGWSLIIESDNLTNVKQSGIVPYEFALSQNYPNPFNPATTINYQLPMKSMVSLKIYDVIGREVATLVNAVMNAGSYSMPFNGSRFASGVYFYRFVATATNGSHSRFTDVKKMILLK
jgi:photosystem II stability/assembly factor-like uncharacterized protein